MDAFVFVTLIRTGAACAPERSGSPVRGVAIQAGWIRELWRVVRWNPRGSHDQVCLDDPQARLDSEVVNVPFFAYLDKTSGTFTGTEVHERRRP
jgi:hypothetical protein